MGGLERRWGELNCSDELQRSAPHSSEEGERERKTRAREEKQHDIKKSLPSGLTSPPASLALNVVSLQPSFEKWSATAPSRSMYTFLFPYHHTLRARIALRRRRRGAKIVALLQDGLRCWLKAMGAAGDSWELKEGCHEVHGVVEE